MHGEEVRAARKREPVEEGDAEFPEDRRGAEWQGQRHSPPTGGLGD